MAGYLPSSSYLNIVHVLQHSDAGGQASTVTYSVLNQLGATASQVAQQVGEDFINIIQPIMDSQVTFSETLAYEGPTPSVVVGGYPSTEVGDSTSAKPPPSVNLLVHKRTGYIGRRSRGRMYVPWVLDEGSLNEVGTVTPAALAVRQNAFSSFLSLIAGRGLPMHLCHSEPTSGTPLEVTELVCDPIVGSQRRRVRR